MSDFLKIFIALIAFCLLNSASAALAEENAKGESKDPKTIKSGVIASYGTAKTVSSTNLNSVDSSPGEEQSPVTASVSRKGSSRCIAVVKNTSKESSYSVSFDVVATSGSSVSKQNYSATIKPNSSVEKTISCLPDSKMEVFLRSGKKI